MEKLGENIINFFSEKLEDLKELITGKTKKKLAELKASFAEKYVKKYIDDPLLKVTGLVQTYMLEKGIIGKIKNELIYEKLLEKSNLEEETKEKIKKLKDELKEVNNEEELSKIEEREINNNSKEEFDPKEIKEYTNGDLLFIDKVQENQKEFGEKVIKISKKLNINPNRLMWVMNKESGLNHKEENKEGSGAIGLIQFMPDTAETLGTTTEKLKKMTNIEQLDYVEKYYKQYEKYIKNGRDLYMATFYPKAIGKPDDYIIGSEDGRSEIIGKQNNMNNKKPITVGHVYKRLENDIPSKLKSEFLG